MNTSTKPLTPEESAYLASSHSCVCEHREIFHRIDYYPHLSCQVPDCDCPHFNRAYELPDPTDRVQHLHRWRSMIEAQLPNVLPDNSDFLNNPNCMDGSIEYDLGSDPADVGSTRVIFFEYSKDEVFLSWCLAGRLTEQVSRPLNSSDSGEQWIRDFLTFVLGASV